ncbi:MAG: hypothetical protein SNJ64_01045 [Endomicrobiia bacterium]
MNHWTKIVATIFVILSHMLYAETVYLGYTGYAHGSSRVIGMGGAFTGISDDINSVLYNPAGFVFSEFKNILSLNHLRFIDKSIDLDPTSEHDVWISQSTNLGILHQTKKRTTVSYGGFIYTVCTNSLTNDFNNEELFFIPIGSAVRKI